jgi:hypothetical protein
VPSILKNKREGRTYNKRHHKQQQQANKANKPNNDKAMIQARFDWLDSFVLK